MTAVRIALPEPPGVHSALAPVSVHSEGPVPVAALAGILYLPAAHHATIDGVQVAHSHVVAPASLLNVESHAEIPYGILVQAGLRSVIAVHPVLLGRVAEPAFHLEVAAAGPVEGESLDCVSQTARGRFFSIWGSYRPGGQLQTEGPRHGAVSARITEGGAAEHHRRPLILIHQSTRNIEVRVLGEIGHQCHPSVEASVEHVIAEYVLQRAEAAFEYYFVNRHINIQGSARDSC